MHSQRFQVFLLLSTLLLSLKTFCAPISPSNELDSMDYITLNGKRTRVYFNDGDTFKILSGKFKNRSVRVTGFNTLENYGPVHEWAQMASMELNKVAIDATLLTREGSWHCSTQKGSDRYGRMLADCDDLGLALIEAGLAHAFSMDETPAKAIFLKAQSRAQSNRLGMWRSGIPRFIITSLHSTTEGNSSYNRLISTKDGHTEKWFHKNTYATCETVCLENERSCMVYVPFEIRYVGRPACLLIADEMCNEARNNNEMSLESISEV